MWAWQGGAQGGMRVSMSPEKVKLGPAGQTLDEMMPTLIDDATKAAAGGNASFYKLKKTDVMTKDEKWLNGFLDVEPDRAQDPYMWQRWNMGNLMQMQEVQFFFLGLVCLNGIFIGITTDHEIPGSNAIEMVFLSFFILEIALKLFAFEFLFWNDNWNTADFIIVLIAILDVIISESGAVDDDGTGLSVLRVVRIFRLPGAKRA